MYRAKTTSAWVSVGGVPAGRCESGGHSGSFRKHCLKRQKQPISTPRAPLQGPTPAPASVPPAGRRPPWVEQGPLRAAATHAAYPCSRWRPRCEAGSRGSASTQCWDRRCATTGSHSRTAGPLLVRIAQMRPGTTREGPALRRAQSYQEQLPSDIRLVGVGRSIQRRSAVWVASVWIGALRS